MLGNAARQRGKSVRGDRRWDNPAGREMNVSAARFGDVGVFGAKVTKAGSASSGRPKAESPRPRAQSPESRARNVHDLTGRAQVGRNRPVPVDEGLDAPTEVVPAISRRQLLTFNVGSQDDADSDHWIHVHRTAMACRFEVILPGEAARHVDAARRALDEADRLEASLTVFRDSSDLVRVNRTAATTPAEVDEQLFDLLRLCGLLSAQTGGAFDITSTPLSRCWGFLYRDGRLPSEAEIDQARRVVGMHRIELDPRSRTVRFRVPGMELNLGSIGKGYALDCMAALLERRGVRNALLSAGGSSIVAIGGARSGWPIDLRSPLVTRDRLARVRLTGGALATSGAGEQFVIVNGERYGHVLDPRTGWPARGVLSATVITKAAAVADALSTALLVGGAELAARYCDDHPDTLAILTPDDGSDRIRVFGSFFGASVEEASCS
jgi:thiamine biosynthesis lipoprotein